MTEQKVNSIIHTIKKHRRLAINVNGVIDAVDYDNVDFAIDVLQNQISKKVKKIPGSYDVCPKCERVVGSRANYCKHCGQKIYREES